MKTNTFAAAIAVAALTLSAGCLDPGPGPDQSLWYVDLDGDRFGDASDVNPVLSSFDPSDEATAYSNQNTDCDDADLNNFPGNPETNDEFDNNCNGVIDEFTIGSTGPAGGIVFYLDETGEHGLEAAPEDQDGGTGAEWGCDGTDITGAAGRVIGTGAQNTADMLAAECSPRTAGHALAADLVNSYALNGYNDWFLPSVWELIELYSVRRFVPGFDSMHYWSSTEQTGGCAWITSFIDEDNDAIDFKPVLNRVRAVRAF